MAEEFEEWRSIFEDSECGKDALLYMNQKLSPLRKGGYSILVDEVMWCCFRSSKYNYNKDIFTSHRINRKNLKDDCNTSIHSVRDIYSFLDNHGDHTNIVNIVLGYYSNANGVPYVSSQDLMVQLKNLEEGMEYLRNKLRKDDPVKTSMIYNKVVGNLYYPNGKETEHEISGETMLVYELAFRFRKWTDKSLPDYAANSFHTGEPMPKTGRPCANIITKFYDATFKKESEGSYVTDKLKKLRKTSTDITLYGWPKDKGE